MKLDLEDYLAMSYINSNAGREAGPLGIIEFFLGMILGKILIGLLAVIAFILYFNPGYLIVLAVLAFFGYILYSTFRKDEPAAPVDPQGRTPEQVKSDADFEAWCKSRGL